MSDDKPWWTRFVKELKDAVTWLRDEGWVWRGEYQKHGKALWLVRPVGPNGYEGDCCPLQIVQAYRMRDTDGIGSRDMCYNSVPKELKELGVYSKDAARSIRFAADYTRSINVNFVVDAELRRAMAEAVGARL